MAIQFKDIPIGTVFYLHHKDGMKGVKQSTRTARFINYKKIFYVGQKETVHVGKGDTDG